MKKSVIILILLSCLSTAFGQKMPTHTFEEVDQLMVTTPKPIVIFFHTNWCKYCKLMENTTFKDKEVITKLEKDFYFVSFNPEEPKDILFRNHTFKYIPTGKRTGMNELAKELAEINGTIAYPTICILNEKYEIIFQIASMLDSKQFLTVLNEIK